MINPMDQRIKSKKSNDRGNNVHCKKRMSIQARPYVEMGANHVHNNAAQANMMHSGSVRGV